MTRAQRHAYMASRAWALRREKIRKRSRGICERCRAARMDAVHHLTYARLGHEWDSDLLAICDPCHAFVSGKSNHDPLNVGPWKWLKRVAVLGIGAYLAWELL